MDGVASTILLALVTSAVPENIELALFVLSSNNGFIFHVLILSWFNAVQPLNIDIIFVTLDTSQVVIIKLLSLSRVHSDFISELKILQLLNILFIFVTLAGFHIKGFWSSDEGLPLTSTEPLLKFLQFLNISSIWVTLETSHAV